MSEFNLLWAFKESRKRFNFHTTNKHFFPRVYLIKLYNFVRPSTENSYKSFAENTRNIYYRKLPENFTSILNLHNLCFMKKSQCPAARAAAAVGAAEEKNFLKAQTHAPESASRVDNSRERPIKVCNGVKWACNWARGMWAGICRVW